MALLLVALAAYVFVSPAVANVLTPESGGSAGANGTDSLFKIVLYVALGVFIAVEGTLIYSIFKFRHKRRVEPAEFNGNNRVEIGWTVGAGLILVFLAILTFTRLNDISNPPGKSLPEPERVGAGSRIAEKADSRLKATDGGRLNIGVSGRQYIWRYTYPDGSYSYHDLVVPVDTVVILRITSTDVAHSWWIPKLGGKKDAIPGYVQHAWFKADKPGEFKGQCAEFCGAHHANMTARVRVVSKPDYEQWLSQRKIDIERAGQELDRLKPKFNQLKSADDSSRGGEQQ